ncbi:MAG: conjugal transfer protein TraU, partial [Gammaproteobacteria bacterium]
MRKFTWALTILLCVTNLAQASSACKGHFINPITDVCWNCLFPLTIGKS